MKKIENDVYELKKDGSTVFLNVTIGYRQTGTIRISWKGEVKEVEGSTRIELGEDKELYLEDLKVEGSIQDIQKDLDHVSMTVALTGGKKPESWTVGCESEDGKVYYLKVGITFID